MQTIDNLQQLYDSLTQEHFVYNDVEFQEVTGMHSECEAVLSSCGDMTSFSVDDYVIRFKTSRNLLRYEQILTWDNGYIECLASYGNPPVTEEDYIDLVPILENLYFDPDEFLEGIERVRIQYA